jgi:hypothetical protein
MFFKAKFGPVKPPFKGKGRRYEFSVTVPEKVIGHVAVLYDNISGARCTAFYINGGQVFVTAAHTFYGLDTSRSALEKRDTHLIIFLEGQRIFVPVIALNVHETTDIAVGATYQVKHKDTGWRLDGIATAGSTEVEEEELAYVGFERMHTSVQGDTQRIDVETSLVVSTFLGVMNENVYVPVGPKQTIHAYDGPFLRMECPQNMGMSGGPVIGKTAGTCVGVLSHISASGTLEGFATPISRAFEVKLEGEPWGDNSGKTLGEIWDSLPKPNGEQYEP